MNSDPNQPQDQPQQPEESPQVPAPEQPVVEAPVAPAQASNTFGATVNSPVSNSAAPSPKSNKKLIILISAIVGGLIVLGGAALAVYLIFFSVTKADYQKTYDQVSLVRDKYKDAGSVSASSSEEKIKETKADFEEFKTENAKLGDLKAIKMDKELKEKYEAYSKKATAYIALGNTLFPSLERFIEASADIKAIGSPSSNFTSANIQKIINILKDLDDITDPTLKTYLASTIEVYEDILPQVKIYESSTATTAEKRAAVTAMSTSLRDVSKAASTLTADLKEKSKEAELADTLNDLGKTATSKLNDAK